MFVHIKTDTKLGHKTTEWEHIQDTTELKYSKLSHSKFYHIFVLATVATDKIRPIFLLYGYECTNLLRLI